MKQKTITLSLFLLTVAGIVVVIIQHLAESSLVAGGILLGVMAIVLWSRRNRPFRENIPVFLRSWLLQYIVFSNLFLPMPNFESQFENLMYGVGEILARRIEFWIGAAALFVIIVIVKNRTHPALVLFTYGAVYLMSSVAADVLAYSMVPYQYQYGSTFMAVIYLLLLASLVRELRGSLRKVPAPSLRLFFLRGLWFIGLVMIFQEAALSVIRDMLGNTMVTLALPGIFAVLLLISEEAESEWIPTAEIYENDVVGMLLLVWCAMAVVMNWWSGFYNETVLFLGIPITLLVYDYITAFCATEKCWPTVSGKPLAGIGFLIAYSALSFLSLLAAGKTANRIPQYFLLLTVLLAVRYVCLKWKKRAPRQWIMPCFWGIFWMLLAVGSTMDFADLKNSLGKILTVVFLGIMWWVFCAARQRITHSSSNIFTDEYTGVMVLQENIPKLMAGLTLLLLLLHR